jgi:hypothetical protein
VEVATLDLDDDPLEQPVGAPEEDDAVPVVYDAAAGVADRGHRRIRQHG